MATRLYLTNAAPTYTPPTRRGAWDLTTQTVARALLESKSGTNVAVTQAETSATTNYNVFLGRWISEAGVVRAPGTLTGNLTTCIARSESSTSLNAFKHVHVYVTVGDSDTVRGTLVANDLGPIEWTTTLTANEDTVAMASVDVQPGDRIVVEVGYEARNTSTTSMSGTIRYGGTDATDLVDNDTTTATTRSPWVQFEDPLGVLRDGVDVPASRVETVGATDASVSSVGWSRTAGADPAGAVDGALANLAKGVASAGGAKDNPAALVRTVRRVPGDAAYVSDQVAVDLSRADIEDYQFVISEGPQDTTNRWVPFGFGHTVVVENFDPGSADLRTQDVLSPVGDHRWFGTDLKTPPTWSFDLYTDIDYDPRNPDQAPREALAWAENLEAVWNAEDVRRNPNAVLPLRYRVAGRTRRVYGRPGNFAVVPNYIRTGRVSIVADFRLAENTYYDDEQERVIVGTVPSSQAATGFTYPVTYPVTIGAPGDSSRVEQLVVTGRRPTWLEVLFWGPSQDPWIQIGERRWGMRGTIGAGQWVRMTGQPWQTGLLRSDGAWVPGMLDPRARLSQLRLWPGQYPVKYGAFDVTGTSTAEVAWRPAYGTM